MIFRTEINIPKQESVINYDSKMVLFGSCFAENISDKLNYFRFQYLVNPFGILFHPVAIETAFKDIINQRIYTEDDLYFNNELWQSFNHQIGRAHV